VWWEQELPAALEWLLRARVLRVMALRVRALRA